MRVTADLDLCQGHQMCQLEAPNVFGLEQGDDHVVVLQPHPEEPERENVARAVRYCPAMALSMSEED